MASLGKILLVIGAVVVALGLLLVFFDRIPLIGKLPGDIHVKKDGFQLYFPLTSSIVISILISLILWLISLMEKK
jgi:hypothetical protein